MGQGVCPGRQRQGRGQCLSSDHCGRLVLLLGAALPLAVYVALVHVVLIRLRALGPHTTAQEPGPGAGSPADLEHRAPWVPQDLRTRRQMA